MSAVFHDRIRKSLENSGLQSALDGNAERRISARRQAVASLTEDLDQIRQRAHALRAETIANLDEHLDHFINNVRANGVEVHRAATAAEAVKIVIDISRQHNARLVAKSKTMVGEEIELNQALEGAGFEVIETDLGEYIVQLRGEHPAHIITPAVHLRRSDCAKTFEEKLGVPYNEDIPEMTAVARRVLRKTFLTSDIGISGVNFGVAETGSMCLFTNEGNGRMVTTLAPVHIALMGIERLVPTLMDLELMMSLLPRSATGQKLTVYTSLIHGPRRTGELDGPSERHLVLVDNGRSSLRNSQLQEILYCIRCGACLNVCPVFREIGGHGYIGVHGEVTPYPGPIGSVISPGLFGQAEFGHLARASSLCGACKEVCPVDIDLPKLLLRIRAGKIDPPPTQQQAALESKTPTKPATHFEHPLHVPAELSLGLRLYTWAAISPARFALAQRLAGFFGRLVAPRSGWLGLPAFTGWGLSRDFPRPAAVPFHVRFSEIDQAAPLHSIVAATTPEAEVDSMPGAPAVVAELSGSALLERFSAEMVALGGTTTVCRTGELSGRVLEFLNSRKIDAIQSWTAAVLPAGLWEELIEAGITIVSSPNPDIRLGLTGALAGVAETGTLILASSPDQPMTASLLPRIHLAVLDSANIYATMREVFKSGGLVRSEITAASSTVLITGPSRTADIEMTLTIGVHGPAELHAFVID